MKTAKFKLLKNFMLQMYDSPIRGTIRKDLLYGKKRWPKGKAVYNSQTRMTCSAIHIMKLFVDAATQLNKFRKIT